MANRHGLIAGATGTGKTVTLRVLAEGLSKMGIPVFMADVKGDLAGLCRAANTEERLTKRAADVGLEAWQPSAFPVVFWDVFGEQGHPVRTTISEVGPLLLARLLNLNETQSGVLQIAFKAADDAGLLLLDLKDLRAMLQFVGENSKEFTLEYGNISAASIGAIQRGLLTLEENGGDRLFGEPALNIDDLLQTDSTGHGNINILAADKLLRSPTIYSTFLLWLLSELFEQLPEVGDLDKPKLVFFFDEAHLLFDEAPRALLEKIEQVVRLIRSKGVGVYFITQSPLDVADEVLAQLGNRVQHALRAFTEKDQKALRATAQNFRSDGTFDIQAALGELAIGEAIVSMLDATGTPTVAQRTLISPPVSRLGPITPEERAAVLQSSIIKGVYETTVDRESAYERLKKRSQTASTTTAEEPHSADSEGSSKASEIFKQVLKPSGTTGSTRGRQGPLEAFTVSIARSAGSQLGRQLLRGLMGSLMGSGSRRR